MVLRFFMQRPINNEKYPEAVAARTEHDIILLKPASVVGGEVRTESGEIIATLTERGWVVLTNSKYGYDGFELLEEANA